MSVALAVDGKDLKKGEDGADYRLGEDVGTSQEDRWLGREVENSQRLHQCLLMARGNDVGALLGKVFNPMDIKSLIVAPRAELHQWAQYIVEPVIVLDCFHNQAILINLTIL